MKPIIPFNELVENINTSEQSWSRYYSNLSGVEDKTISNLMLCILYHNKKISRKSFTTRMTSIDNTRRIGTYKSKVLNKWFQDTFITDILILEAMSCNDRDLTFDNYFEYLNLGLNRNKNYCINLIALDVFNPILNRNVDNFIEFANASKLVELTSNSFDSVDARLDLGYGYCCDDCSGDYREYKYQQYQYYHKVDEKEIIKELKSKFLPIKTHLKNEHDEIINW